MVELTLPHPGTSARPVRGKSTAPDLRRPVRAGCGLPASHGVSLPFLHKLSESAEALYGQKRHHGECTDQASSHPCSFLASIVARRAPNSEWASESNHRLLTSTLAISKWVYDRLGEENLEGVARHSTVPGVHIPPSASIFGDMSSVFKDWPTIFERA